jgi:penicillin-binding protein 2A
MATATKPKIKKRSKWTLRRTLLWTTIIAGTATVCALIGYLIIIYNGQNLLKNVDPSQLAVGSPSTIYDVNNQLVTTLTQQKSDPVEYKDIPPMLINAVIATEDRRFNEHTGVDFISIGRALVKDVVNRSAVEGGSTITQQLAKNILFDHPQKTLFRKATELSLALALEGKYSKNEIITMYLNRINFGSGAYGVKTAAMRYFGKQLKDLNIWEMATLAAIPKSPTYYSPIGYPDKSKERRQVVLKLMNEQGYITTAERDAAMQVNYVPPKQNLAKKEFLTFIDYTVEEAQTMYNIDPDELYRGGYKIYTTMDTNAQRIMEQTYTNDKFFQKSDAEQEFQSAMVITNYKTGGIVAMIGGRDYVNKGLNRVTVPQQPGSAFKPLVVYAPAIETGNWNQYSMLNNDKTDFNGYSPRNYDNNYTGQVSMYEAVKKSINVPAVWLLSQIKLKTGMNFAKNLGLTFKEPDDDNLAIALGGLTIGETPLQMAQAYGSFANNGAMNKSHAIVKITLGDKEVVSFKQEKAKQVMSPKTAYYTTQLLKGVVEPGGTGATARMNRPVVGKTGSTQLTIKGYEKFTRDLWFVGYTPEWSAAVWMGYDKPDAKHYVTIKSDSAAALFKEVMSKALANVPITDFVKPGGVPDLKEPPKPMSDLTAVYDAASNKVNLNWTAVADPAVSYRVYRKASKDADFTLLLEVKDNQGVSDLTLTAGETYQYYVTAYSPDSQTESNKSNIVELVVPASAVSPTPSGSISPSPSDSGMPTDSGSPSPTPDGASPTPTQTTDQPTNSATPKPTATPKPVVGQTPKPAVTPTAAPPG